MTGINFHFLFEQEQRRKQHSFSLVAMDRLTGALVTHTLFESATDYTISALGPRDAMESQRYAEFYRKPPAASPYMSRAV